jgi:hypothetical protein
MENDESYDMDNRCPTEEWSPYENSSGSPLEVDVIKIDRATFKKEPKVEYIAPLAIQELVKSARRMDRLWKYGIPLLGVAAILWAVFGEVGYTPIPLSWHTPEGRQVIESRTRRMPRVPTPAPSPAVGETFTSSPEAALVLAQGMKASALFLNPNGKEAPPLGRRLLRVKLVLADDVTLDPAQKPFVVVNPGSHLVPITHVRSFPRTNTTLLEASFDPVEWVEWLGDKPWIDPMSVPAVYRISWNGKVVSKSKPLNLTLAIPIINKDQRTLFLVNEKQTFINAM